MAEEKDPKGWRAEIPEDDGYEEDRLRRKWEREQELKNAQREKRLREQRQRLRAIMILALTVAVLLIVVVILTVKVFIPLGRYNNANKMLERGEYAEAIVSFRNMLGYKDSAEKLEEAIRLQAVKLAGREDVYYATGNSAPWFEIDERGVLQFSEDQYRGDWSQVVIPDVFDGILVTAIGEKGFAHCEKMTAVTISDCVLRLEKYAFLGCEGLTEVRLPAHLSDLGHGTFENCTSLEQVTMGETLGAIGESAFAGCVSLREITIPDSVTAVGARSFNGCTALTTVSVGSALEKIGSYAFSACVALERLEFRGSRAAWENCQVDPERVGLSEVEIICADS